MEASAGAANERLIIKMDGQLNKPEMQDGTPESTRSVRRSVFRRFSWLWILIAIFIVAAAYLHVRYRSPIDFEKATADKQAVWLLVQDFSRQKTEDREKLFDMYIGKIAAPNPENVEENIYSLPERVQKIVGPFIAGSDTKTESWKSQREWLPYMRIDYRFEYDPEGKSAYITSRDIKPGPSLISRWEKRREEIEQGRVEKISTVEKNIRLLIYQWFVSKYRYYDSVSDNDKKKALETIVKDAENWQYFYNQLRGHGGLEALSRSQLVAMMEMNIDGWLDFAELDQLAKVLWFKDVIVSAIVAESVSFGPDRAADAKGKGNNKPGLFAAELPPRKPTPGDKKESALGGFVEKVTQYFKLAK